MRDQTPRINEPNRVPSKAVHAGSIIYGGMNGNSTLVGVRRLWLRTAGLLVLLVLVAASCDPPGATALSGSETVGRQGQVEFVDDVIRRQVRVSIPAGALEGPRRAVCRSSAVLASTGLVFSRSSTSN